MIASRARAPQAAEALFAPKTPVIEKPNQQSAQQPQVLPTAPSTAQCDAIAAPPNPQPPALKEIPVAYLRTSREIRNWVKYGMTLPRWRRSIGPRSARSSASSAKPDRDGSLALLMAQRSQQCLRPADGRLILKGSASSVTEAFPDMRRARIARRVGSDSAEKVLLRRSGNISVNR